MGASLSLTSGRLEIANLIIIVPAPVGSGRGLGGRNSKMAQQSPVGVPGRSATMDLPKRQRMAQKGGAFISGGAQ